MTVQILTGDCREALAGMAAESVHCCITSPPYWGLRDYGVAGQLGLEPTYQLYVEHMVEVFRAVHRVLRKDGTLWLNLGDSYNAYNGGAGPSSALSQGAQTTERPQLPTGYGLRDKALKPKDLVGIPWRVAFALQADGWYLRQDIIWSKPNPMPESVRDRCTKAHEYLFQLAKSERYYFDAEAIAEPAVMKPQARLTPRDFVNGKDTGRAAHRRPDYRIRDEAEQENANRNKRSVWEIPTSPYAEPHFATFPPALIEPCVLAGCPERCCAKCGAPWVREVEIESRPNAPSCNGKYDGMGKHRTVSGGVSNDCRQRIDRGIAPSCDCIAETQGGTVLDPFFGAGTTGLVADRLQRHCIGIELNPSYAEMARRRIHADAPLFAEVG